MGTSLDKGQHSDERSLTRGPTNLSHTPLRPAAPRGDPALPSPLGPFDGDRPARAGPGIVVTGVGYSPMPVESSTPVKPYPG